MKPEKSDARQAMFSAETTARDMQRFVRIACEAQAWNDNIKARIARAARVLGITQRRAKAFLYMEARVIPAHEYMRLRSIVDEIEQQASAVRKHHEYVASVAIASVALDSAPLRPDQPMVRGEGRDDQPALPAGGDADDAD